MHGDAGCGAFPGGYAGTILDDSLVGIRTMPVVATETSPLNCRWISWNNNLPVCTRPPGPPHRVTEAECSICEYWNDENPHADQHPPASAASAHPHPYRAAGDDPLNRESCPQCGSHDVELLQRDAVVQSFSCSICHQRWLATRPWPLLRDTRSRRSEL
jgi:hypothetical protein